MNQINLYRRTKGVNQAITGAPVRIVPAAKAAELTAKEVAEAPVESVVIEPEPPVLLPVPEAVAETEPLLGPELPPEEAPAEPEVVAETKGEAAAEEAQVEEATTEEAPTGRKNKKGR